MAQALPPLLLTMARVMLTSDADALLPHAQAALDAGDRATADWVARRAAALSPEKVWPYVVMAAQAEHDEEGLPLDRRLLRLVPEEDETLRRLVSRLAKRPDVDAVVGGERRALVDDPDDPRALFVTGVLLSYAGDPAGPIALMRAVRLRPHRLPDAYTVGGIATTRDYKAAAAVYGALARLGPPPPAMVRPTAWPLDVVAAVKAGASLASVMIPDPRSPANNPEYLENYCFDQVIASDRCFWALPQPLVVDPARASLSGFAYCGDTRLFLRYETEDGHRAGSPVKLQLYPGDAYKHFEFVVRHDHTPVYDSAEPGRTAALESAIRAGATMRVVAEAADGMVHALPVNLCFLYRESGAVQVTTELRYAPELCLIPVESLWPYMSRLLEIWEQRPSFLESLIYGQSRLAARRLVLHSDGWCDSFDAAGAVRRGAGMRFRVFARL